MGKEEWQEMFALLDEAGAGKIPANKFGLCIRALRTYPTDEEVTKLLKEADPKNSGYVDFDAICAAMAKAPKLDKAGTIEAFKIFDKDDNGTVSAMELKHVLVSMGNKLTQDEAADFVNEADMDRDGMLVYTDFLKAITEG